MEDLGVVQGLPKHTLQLTVTCPIYMIAKATWLICHQTVSTEYVTISTHIQAGFTFFNITPVRVFTSVLDVINATSRYPFVLPTKSKILSFSIIKYIVCVLRSLGYICAVICID